MSYVYVNKDFLEETPTGHRVVGSKCGKCGMHFFPKKTYCTKCMTDEGMQVVELSKKGKLASYSVAVENLAGVVMGFSPPYAFGYVDLPEGIRLFSQILDCEPFEEKLKIGMDLEMEVRKIRQDEWENDILSYVFRPAGQKEEKK